MVYLLAAQVLAKRCYYWSSLRSSAAAACLTAQTRTPEKCGLWTC